MSTFLFLVPPPQCNRTERYIQMPQGHCSVFYDAELLHIRVLFEGFCICLESGYGDILQRESQVVTVSPARGRQGKRGWQHSLAN